jgi:starch synthase
MYIVQIAAECAPVAKVGGLGDVVYGLSRELEVRGHSVEIILPKYQRMRHDHVWGLQVSLPDLWVPWLGGGIHCTVWFGFVHGRKCFFIEPHSADNYFNRPEFYGYLDEVLRWSFFSKAALEFLLKSGKRPDIIHAHDWQTALVPVLLYEIYATAGLAQQRVCFTVHNFKHQGVTGPQFLDATGLGRHGFFGKPEKFGDDIHPGAYNLLKGGIVYANFTTTVSPRHAWEAHFTDQGAGLGATLETHQLKFGGVLNGVDYDVWNPEVDPYLARRYGPGTVEVKYVNKAALRQRFLLRDAYQPIIAYIGRLDHQKGVELIRHTLFWAINHGAQFLLLGTSPLPELNTSFRNLKQLLNDNPDCHLELGFSEELAHLIYAGSDLLIMPSLYEPCGLTQMIALKYGTVPIVRAVGGLMDTVFDRDFSNRLPEHRNGFVFQHPDHAGIESALDRAAGLWNYFPAEFRKLLLQGMRCDYSWNVPGQHYLNIYEYIRHK